MIITQLSKQVDFISKREPEVSTKIEPNFVITQHYLYGQSLNNTPLPSELLGLTEESFAGSTYK